MTDHTLDDILLDLAAGDGDGAGEANALLQTEEGRQRLEDLRRYMAVVRAELLEMRPACPSTDELANLSPGAEYDHPHLQECPLCREEVRLRFAAESSEHLGLDDLPADAPFYRAMPVVAAGAFAYQRAGGTAEMVLEEDRTFETVVGGVTVSLRCAEGQLEAKLSGAPEQDLFLVLSNDLLEKRILLPAEGLSAACGVFRRARVEAGE